MLIARVVPDVSGIDKEFDYVVPSRLRGRVEIGVRVRIDLHGRRVGGWVVGLGDTWGEGVDPSRLRDIASVSGLGVEPPVVELTAWVAEQWRGSRRAVLASASAPTVRNESRGAVRRGRGDVVDHPVAATTREVLADGGGCVRVPPLDSALYAVLAAAELGPTIVVCPTIRMASLAAGWLRRHHLSVATVPEEWSRARAGVDIVVGARSAVFAPCPQLAAMVVIDEHDESLKEERNPTWDALAVAQERAQREGARVVSTSPVPTARTHDLKGEPGREVIGAKGWPLITVTDMTELTPAGSLLGSEMLDASRDKSLTTLCILNTVGVARLVTCRSCRSVQKCGTCRSLLSHVGAATDEADDLMWCTRCGQGRGGVCLECGRTSLLSSRLGTAGLASQIERATGVAPVEVTSQTRAEDLRGGLFVGTESVLYRVSDADVVVFADLDRDLSAPRVTAPREVLALVVKAARIVGSSGRLVIQTRDPGHPLWRALTAQSPDQALAAWCESDLATRRALGMPPASACARVVVDQKESDHLLQSLIGEASDDRVDVSLQGLDPRGRAAYLVRATSRDALMAVLEQWQSRSEHQLRVHVDPVRY